MKVLGFDIGGTKSAVLTANTNGETVSFSDRRSIPTDFSISPKDMLERLFLMADDMLGTEKPDCIGISCGGPLDSKKGVILSPPNLPGWDEVAIVSLAEEHFGTRAFLQNDANACAVAEWKFGAGRGTRNMIFLTCGTGMGAGLIIDGNLYEGTNGYAGEVGHMRLAKDGPVGFGKAGSFEGFCSGGGIRRLAEAMAEKAKSQGITPAYCKNPDGISAKTVATAALAGDETAREVYRISGEKLGYALSLLIDVLNPEKIVIGSVFARSGELLIPSMNRIIEDEALSCAASVCRVVPAALGDKIGDYATVAIALQN